MSDDTERESHLSAADLSAYLDDEAPPEARRRIEAHLSRCEVCRAEAAAVFRTVESAGPVARRTLWRTAAGAAAAVVAILIGVRVVNVGGPDAPVLRGSQESREAEGVPRMTVHAPENRRNVPLDSLVFVWEARGAEAVYRFTLTDDAGDVLWRLTTTDTLLVPGDAIALVPDRDYFWIVDALYEGGRSATTGARMFRVRRE